MLRLWPCGAVPKNKFGHWWDMNGYRSRRADVAFCLASYSSHSLNFNHPSNYCKDVSFLPANFLPANPEPSPIKRKQPRAKRIPLHDVRKNWNGRLWSRCKLRWCNPMLCLSLCWHLTSRKWELQKPVAWLWPRIVLTTHLSCLKRDSIPTSSYIYPPPPRIEKSKWV